LKFCDNFFNLDDELEADDEDFDDDDDDDIDDFDDDSDDPESQEEEEIFSELVMKGLDI